MPFNKESDVLSLDSVRGHGSDSWILEEDVFYFHQQSRAGVIVRKGLTTDLASIPRLAKLIISNDNPKIRRPALVHDDIYRSKGLRKQFSWNLKTYPARRISRAQADRIFHDALREEGVNMITSALMYLAVRVGGWVAWND